MSSKESRASNNKSKKRKNTSNHEDDKQQYPGGYDKRPVLLEGEERKVHVEIVKRRIEGGASPTPEAYARALKQWQEIPGSVVRPPTDVTIPQQKHPKASDETGTSEHTDHDKHDGEE